MSSSESEDANMEPQDLHPFVDGTDTEATLSGLLNDAIHRQPIPETLQALAAVQEDAERTGTSLMASETQLNFQRRSREELNGDGQDHERVAGAITARERALGSGDIGSTSSFRSSGGVKREGSGRLGKTSEESVNVGGSPHGSLRRVSLFQPANTEMRNELLRSAGVSLASSGRRSSLDANALRNHILSRTESSTSPSASPNMKRRGSATIQPSEMNRTGSAVIQATETNRPSSGGIRLLESKRPSSGKGSRDSEPNRSSPGGIQSLERTSSASIGDVAAELPTTAKRWTSGSKPPPAVPNPGSNRGGGVFPVPTSFKHRRSSLSATPYNAFQNQDVDAGVSEVSKWKNEGSKSTEFGAEFGLRGILKTTQSGSLAGGSSPSPVRTEASLDRARPSRPGAAGHHPMHSGPAAQEYLSNVLASASQAVHRTSISEAAGGGPVALSQRKHRPSLARSEQYDVVTGGGAGGGNNGEHENIPVPLVPSTYLSLGAKVAIATTRQAIEGEAAENKAREEAEKAIPKVRKLTLADLVSGLRGVKEGDLASAGSKSTSSVPLSMLSGIRKWQKKAKNTPREKMIAAQQDRLRCEIPRMLYLDLLADVIPIVQSAFETYRRQLGDKNPLTISAKAHLDKLLVQQYKKRTCPVEEVSANDLAEVLMRKDFTQKLKTAATETFEKARRNSILIGD